MAEVLWVLRRGPLSFRVVQGNAGEPSTLRGQWYGLEVMLQSQNPDQVFTVGLPQVEATHFLPLPRSDKCSDNSSCHTTSWALPASSSPALSGASTAIAPGTGQESFGLSCASGNHPSP